MATHGRTRDSTAPPSAIWNLWSDTDTWPQWNPDVQSVKLNGPFADGTTGTMTTGAGTHTIHLENVQPGRSFDLITSPMPATTFRFHCEIEPRQDGSQVSQSVSMSGLLGPIVSALMGNRIAGSFEPILAGLARSAESS